jgi:hypothetical protein
LKCIGHASGRQKRIDEERYLSIEIDTQKNKRFKFDHPEKGFGNYGQTVVVWCLTDFLSKREFSEGVYSMLQRQNRNRASTQKFKRGKSFYKEIEQEVGGQSKKRSVSPRGFHRKSGLDKLRADFFKKNR